MLEKPEKSNSDDVVLAEPPKLGDREAENSNLAELNKMSKRLQHRINELERVPAMLKESEERLKEAESKILGYEDEINQYREIVDDLRGQVERFKNARRPESPTSKQQQPINVTINNSDSPKKSGRLVLLDEENRELLRQLKAKDELVRDLMVELFRLNSFKIYFS